MAAYNQHNFEAGLQPGVPVYVRWTKGGQRLSARAKVSAISRGSIAVELVEVLEGYPIGARVSVPRVGTSRWTPRECVLPLEFAPMPVGCKNPIQRNFKEKMQTNQPFVDVSGRMNAYSTWRLNNHGLVYSGTTFLHTYCTGQHQSFV